LLGTVEPEPVVVVADLEAGIGTLMRLSEGAVDVVLVVVEPVPKSIEVGRRALAACIEKNVGRVLIVANRVRDANDLAAVRAAFPDGEIAVVPHDLAIVEADRIGVAPIDLFPGAPSVMALVALADQLA
jgi:CO dehydrogenase nickel-insertion accessory protein CooC1